ncbi:hypothetical protein M8J77_022466 [Diaphorina citri]|nr:hypothetical protein M8J77_022466 [Diaphorina citri]
MTVNVAKSKVTIFRRGGRVASTDVFYYDNERLEVCNEYNYLGVLFSSHGVFHKAAEQALSRGRVAVGNVRQILVKSKSDTLESRMKLFHAIVKSTLLYGAEIWASRYGETIEKCQTLFLKSLYCLPKCTQSNMLRAEMGVVKLSYYAFSQTLEWWSKILKMSLDRYPRMCYEQLLSMDQRSSNIMKYNWCTLLKNKLVELELADVWEAQCSATLEGRKQEILNTYYSKLIEEDWTSLTHSSYNILFKEIKVKPENVSPDRSFVSPYLLEQAPIERSRVAAQLRLCGRNVKIYINRMTYGWNQEEICTTCNQRKPEDIQHFLVDCPQYSSLRSRYLRDILDSSNSVKMVLDIKSKDHLNNLYYYVQEISSVVPTFVPESSRTAQLRGFRSAFGTPSSASSSHSGSHSIEELTQENSSNAPHGDGSHRMVDGTSRRGEFLRDRKMQDNFVDRRIGLGTRGAYQLKHSPSTGMESPPKTWHIKRRELHAVFWTISRNPEIFRDRSVTLLTDSTVVAGQIRNQGGLRSPSLLEETWNLLHLVSSLNAQITPVYNPSLYNSIADSLSRNSLPPEWHLSRAAVDPIFRRWGFGRSLRIKEVESGRDLCVTRPSRQECAFHRCALKTLGVQNLMGFSPTSFDTADLEPPERSLRNLLCCGTQVDENVLAARSAESSSDRRPHQNTESGPKSSGPNNGKTPSERTRHPAGSVEDTGWKHHIAELSTSERNLLNSAWRPPTKATYCQPWKRWTKWAKEKGVDHLRPSCITFYYLDYRIAPVTRFYCPPQIRGCDMG